MSNLEAIFSIIESFTTNCTIISGVHITEKTGNLSVFFSEELPVSQFNQLESEIKDASSEHGVIYNPKSYNPETQKFVDARLTFFEGESAPIEERIGNALTKLKANFSK
tara:strand:+ start:383 stop:709 length:327 start_codon:yes stop_codon:yes gene_type:complete